jgi:hypothetical protein
MVEGATSDTGAVLVVAGPAVVRTGTSELHALKRTATTSRTATNWGKRTLSLSAPEQFA